MPAPSIDTLIGASLPDAEKKQALRVALAGDPLMAHEVLFARSHQDASPAFHKDMLRLYHSPHRHVVVLAFRGSAKSTRLEEFAIIQAVQKTALNILIVGESWQRACERLRAVKRELAQNDMLIWLYGYMQGETWAESRVVLSNGVALTAIGQGQALRGIKHHTSRPDVCLVDDLESTDTAATPEARRKLADWFWADLLPALAPSYRLRMAATPFLDGLAVNLSKLPSFKSLTVPICYIDKDGVERSSWPSRFPLERVKTLENDYKAAGALHKFMSEYMVQAVDPELQVFKPSYFHYDSLLEHSWQPVYVAIDPARTVTKSSAATGVVAVSFTGEKVIVWEAAPYKWTPREIIDEIFRLEARYKPVAIGVERNGLDEFLLQPIREECIRRGVLLPIVPLLAPRGKPEFVRRLQPLFEGGHIVFAGAPEKFKAAVDQFLSFPLGLIDVPNAMAYIFSLREGAPVYPDAGLKHMADSLPVQDAPWQLGLNAGPHGTAAVLFQYHRSVMSVHAAWAAPEPPSVSAASFVEEARVYAGRAPRVVIPPLHFESKTTYGLLAACKGVTAAVKGGSPEQGRDILRRLLREDVRGAPALLIGGDAQWVRRAVSGGYSWDTGRTTPRSNIYEHIMVALESAVAPASAAANTQPQRMVTAPDGTRYATAAVAWR